MGVVKYFKIDFDRYTYHRANYYDRNGCLQKFGEYDCLPDYNKQLAMPQKLDEMISLAEKLSEGYPFMRVDFTKLMVVFILGE